MSTRKLASAIGSELQLPSLASSVNVDISSNSRFCANLRQTSTVGLLRPRACAPLYVAMSCEQNARRGNNPLGSSNRRLGGDFGPRRASSDRLHILKQLIEIWHPEKSVHPRPGYWLAIFVFVPAGATSKSGHSSRGKRIYSKAFSTTRSLTAIAVDLQLKPDKGRAPIVIDFLRLRTHRR